MSEKHFKQIKETVLSSNETTYEIGKSMRLIESIMSDWKSTTSEEQLSLDMENSPEKQLSLDI